MTDDLDAVFKALADQSRRHLLDRLRINDGQTLTALCEDLAMSRQAVTQHIAVLKAANLVIIIRKGREKLHYLNALPIQQISARWIERFELPRLRALLKLRQRLEGG